MADRANRARRREQTRRATSRHSLRALLSTLLAAILLSFLTPTEVRAQTEERAAERSRPPQAERLFGRGLAGELTLSGGIQFSSGDYTDDVTTDQLYFPLSIAYAFDTFGLTPTPNDLLEFKVSIPFLYVSGPGNPADNPSDTIVAARGGIGNITVKASYVYLPDRDSALPVFELSGKIQIPTASTSKELGTGALAGSFQFEISKTFGKQITPIAMLGFRFTELVEDFDLENSVFLSLGLDYRLSRRFSAGVFYDYYESTSAANRAADAHEISSYLLVRIGKGFRLAPNVLIGLSKGSPDYAVGLQLRYTMPVQR